MRTGDLLALRFFLLPADHDRCSSDCTLKYTFNFVLNIRRLENNTADFFISFILACTPMLSLGQTSRFS